VKKVAAAAATADWWLASQRPHAAPQQHSHRIISQLFVHRSGWTLHLPLLSGLAGPAAILMLDLL
jgi:hypothetical protein